MTSTPQNPSPTPETARTGGRVLIVSGSAHESPYGAPLRRFNMDVQEVPNAAAALVAMRRYHPQVVIVEIGLRGVTAGEFTKLLSSAKEGAPLVLVGQSESTRDRRLEAVEAGAFDYFQMPEELPLLIARAEQLVDLERSKELLRDEADRDYLTGLANRRRFRNALGKEVERWRRYRTPCALLLADIDHLKKINDTYGHSGGDMVIRHVANALTKTLRDNDTAARLGGEEFALLLAATDADKALAAAERLRQAVCSEAVSSIGVVTISIGVAACPAHAQSERDLYGSSDAALYRAKGEGRNRTAIATTAAAANQRPSAPIQQGGS